MKIEDMTDEEFAIKRSYMLARDWPKRAVDAAFKADTTKSAVMQLAGWKLEERNVAILSGNVGSGKTVGAARWCMGRLERIQFVRAATFAAVGRYDKEARVKWYEADGLCIDDLGAEYADKNESFLVDLDEIIDTFYADQRPLILTTNLVLGDFKLRYGNRVTDRIAGCARWIQVVGGSMRGQNS